METFLLNGFTLETVAKFLPNIRRISANQSTSFPPSNNIIKFGFLMISGGIEVN